MNFSDESYVRLYVRDTKTWLRLGFEGQCLLMFLLRKLDRAGVLDDIDDAGDVALITGVPVAIVEIGLPRLLERGVFEHSGGHLVMPNFIEAQSAAKTDRARQKDARDRRLAEARLVTIRDGAVTPRDESITSRDETVTENETALQPVTPILSSPSQTNTPAAPGAPTAGRSRARGASTDPEVLKVYARWREVMAGKLKLTSLSETAAKLVRARVRSLGLDEVIAAIEQASREQYRIDEGINYLGCLCATDDKIAALLVKARGPRKTSAPAKDLTLAEVLL